MADLSQFTDQERALLAQYLALKAGGVGNAPALVQMVLDRLASGQYGSTLTEVVAGLIPEGIPLGTDYSEYMQFVNTGAVPPPAAQPYYGSSGDGESAGSAEPFLPNGGVTTGSLLKLKPFLESRPLAPGEEGGMFGVPMSSAIPPQGPPPPEMVINPLFPDLPRRDPRVASVAPATPPGPFGGDLGAPVAADPLAKPPRPTAIAPPPLPAIDPAYLPAGAINPNKTAERLPAPPPLSFDPTAPQEPFKYVSPSTFPARPAVIPGNTAPAPALATRSVTTQPINPTTGMPVDFAGLQRTALNRDLTGPLDYGPVDTGISALSGMVAAQPRPAPAQPSTFPARPEFPGALPAATPIGAPTPATPGPAVRQRRTQPALTPQVLDDWINQQGLRNPVGPISLDFSTLPAPEPGAQAALDMLLGNDTKLVASAKPEPANTVYQPTPAPLPAARMAINAVLPENAVNLTTEEREYLARAVATEVDPRIAQRDPAAYQQQVYRVVDVILNRVASDRFGGSIVDVLNQPRQFSAIAGPKSKKGERYGSVEKIPPDRADPDLRRMVDTWISEREAGAPSSVGGALNYANPKAADASNMRWINGLDGPRDDAGPFSHWYGTADGYTPTEAVLRNPALDAADGLAKGAGWLSTQPQTPISTTGALAAEKLRSKQAMDSSFNLAIQAAAQQQRESAQNAAKIAQSYTSRDSDSGGSDGGPFNYDKYVGKQDNSPGSGGDYSPGTPFTPSSPKSKNTPKTTPSKNTPSYTSGSGGSKTSNTPKTGSKNKSSSGSIPSGYTYNPTGR